jgi:hypothetical protein
MHINPRIRYLEDDAIKMGWSGGWLRLAGSIRDPPAVISRSENFTDVFGRSLDNRLWQITWSRGGGWGAWTRRDEDGFILDSSPVADSMGPDHVHLFARGTDGQLYQKWWTGAKGWQTDLNTVDVGTCLMGQTPTDDQDRLFNNRNNVGSKDIVVYFVRTIPGFAGCASHPAGKQVLLSPALPKSGYLDMNWVMF